MNYRQEVINRLDEVSELTPRYRGSAKTTGLDALLNRIEELKVELIQYEQPRDADSHIVQEALKFSVKKFLPEISSAADNIDEHELAMGFVVEIGQCITDRLGIAVDEEMAEFARGGISGYRLTLASTREDMKQAATRYALGCIQRLVHHRKVSNTEANALISKVGDYVYPGAWKSGQRRAA